MEGTEWRSAEDGGKEKPGASAGGASEGGAVAGRDGASAAVKADAGRQGPVLAQQVAKLAQEVQARPALRQEQRVVLHLEVVLQRQHRALGSAGSQSTAREGGTRVVGRGQREVGGLEALLGLGLAFLGVKGFDLLDV